MRFRNLLVIAGLAVCPVSAFAAGLRGSPSSMREQHSVAVNESLSFSDDAAEVRRLVEKGGLEQIVPNADYGMSGVSYPYAVPEVRTFVERIARQYREANGAMLVVTSLTRPSSLQPRNAHELSVHPAGMAVDFRVPETAKERQWLESVLLKLENAGVLDVTRERFPPHYHVAVFPIPYAAYVARLEKVKPAPAPAVFTTSAAPVAIPAAVSVSAKPDAIAAPNHHALLFLLWMSGIAFAALLAGRTLARSTSS